MTELGQVPKSRYSEAGSTPAKAFNAELFEDLLLEGLSPDPEESRFPPNVKEQHRHFSIPEARGEVEPDTQPMTDFMSSS